MRRSLRVLALAASSTFAFRMFRGRIAACSEREKVVGAKKDDEKMTKNHSHNDPFSSCAEPACSHKVDLLRRSFNQRRTYTSSSSSSSTSTSSSSDESNKFEQQQQQTRGSSKDKDKEAADEEDEYQTLEECPLDIAELGTSTWSLMHTIAAYYPDLPTEQEKAAATQLFFALARFYPCRTCAGDFQEYVAAHPPGSSGGSGGGGGGESDGSGGDGDVEAPAANSSREALSLWVCGLHNHVNERLGKPVFKCDIKRLDTRWKKSERQGGCSA